jgi:tagatose 6-phosphate kinase
VIHAVCLNAALDVTYYVPELTPGRSHRVERVTRRAGGKGINVARVLTQLGDDVRVVGFAGGDTGQALVDELATHAVEHLFVAVAGESRRTVTVVSSDHATVFNEPGPNITDSEWDQITAELDSSIAADDVLVLSGSVPPGAPVTAYAELVAIGNDRGAQTVLDAEGDVLRAALASRPALAKPNATETAATFGWPHADPVAAAHALLAAGARGAVVSCGADGLVAVVDERPLRIRLRERISGNPTGAGDALTAGIARGLARGAPWHEVLPDAVALAAAAVAIGHAGEVDQTVRDRIRAHIDVEEI